MVALSSGLLDTERYVVCYPMRSARCRKRAHCCCGDLLDTQTCLILGQTCSKRQAPIGQPDVLQPVEATEGGGARGGQTGKLLAQLAEAAGVPEPEREARCGEALRRLQGSSQFRFAKNMVQLVEREP